MTNEPLHVKNNNLHKQKQRRRSAKPISAFVSATRIVQSLYFLNQNFQSLTIFCDCMYSPVCVGPGRNPICWFSHAQAQITFPIKIEDSAHVLLFPRNLIEREEEKRLRVEEEKELLVRQ